ncbi:MAG: hypothetical protein M3130_01385 [Actinomycetota bacterium]|nr:hypothetical protein [Actinomycetota bacterium]
MRRAGRQTIVRVTDSGTKRILPQHPAAADVVCGRGLRLLEVLATDWGVATYAHRNTVWFTL